MGLFAYALGPLVDKMTLRWFVRDLDMRATLVANALHEPMQEQLAAGSKAKIAGFFARITQDERLFAIGYCAAPDSQPLATRSLPESIRCDDLERWEESEDHLLTTPRGSLHIVVTPMPSEAAPEGRLVLVHDMGFVGRRSEETKRYINYFILGLAAVVSLITVIIAQLSWRGWVAGMRSLLRGEGLLRQPQSAEPAPEFRPIARDLQELIRELEGEYRSRDESQLTWTAETLRAILHSELRGEDVIVVSNREPYIHQRHGERVEVRRPASGLVTALEPIMRACSGVWIAYGGGSADRDVVNGDDRVAVPPEKPAYQLRRVWLTQEEELPKMIRERLPEATIITFWHIPWPNPESFAICPWREEIVAGLLGSSILGFHTQFHCNNFVDTVDRCLEARVDREAFTVSVGGKLTAVRRYPISIAWPPEADSLCRPVDQCRTSVRQELGLPPDHALGVGVDRLDYTKGIAERFRAVERLLELQPEWVGRFSFVQVAAPSRSSIDEYQSHEAQVRALAARINARYTRGGIPPILLLVEHHEPQQVYEYYRAADLCFVSSLHDGMNLVAKEFVAARSDDRGVLILSQFTGAARELPEALIVNPYDTDQCAAALHLALTMPAAEQRDRMRLMRGLVAEFNVYRWAGRMLLDAALMRRRGRLLEKPNSNVFPG